MNFVFVSLQRINTDRESTSTSLAKELAKKHRVLFVNPPIDRKTLLSKDNDRYVKEHIKLIKNGGTGTRSLTDNLYVLNTNSLLESINWIPSTKVFSLFNYVNNRRFARDIKQALSALNFDSFILNNDKDIFRSFYLKELLKPDLYIYLDRDYTLGVDYWKRHGEALEPKLIKKSDLVICNSNDFVRSAKKYNPNSFYIGNGVDLELFNNDILHDIPARLKNLDKPIIGYVGALSSLRLDLDLIINIATAKPEYNFVLIGEEDKEFSKSILHEMKNVHFFGKIDKKNIPSYVQYFSVCINPQLLNEITIGNFPLKIVEYLAMGKPVVAKSTNTMKEVFSEHTYLANDAPEFADLITKALSEDNSALHSERISFAKGFSWDKVVSLLNESIRSCTTNNPTLI
jgi:glycosyltransferase involved in cell wall biosynthesis